MSNTVFAYGLAGGLLALSLAGAVFGFDPAGLLLRVAGDALVLGVPTLALLGLVAALLKR